MYIPKISRISLVKFTAIATLNTEVYTGILRPLTDEVRKKITPQKMENQELILFHHNAPAHRSVLVKDCLANNNATKL
jgi:hypothetical protein